MKKNDFLSKESVLKVIERRLDINDKTKNIFQEILSMPAAEVAPIISGHWIISERNLGFCEQIMDDYIEKKYKCSVCGYETGSQAENFKCCPICTARMKGKKNEID